ncbi:MAG: nucleoside hydrolase [Chloroflexi bacterium]|nr:nucleoside hydrolase [Chloroflexota bacterium]MCC6895200.1 nucleoside hydrolase [Anaerolineae bacterium]
MAIPFIVDTDCAFDDWLALAYLMQCDSVDLRGVTVAGTGEVHARAGVDTVLRLLQLGQCEVPVTSGRTTPLQGQHRFPLFVRLVMDFRLGLFLPKTQQKPWHAPAYHFLANEIASSREKVTLLTLGPLTNVAEMLLEYPALAEQIEMIYVMGGALNTAGNLAEMLPKTENRWAEWNIYVDYYAADVVLRSGAPVTLIPLDVTNTLPLTDDVYHLLTDEPLTPLDDFVARVVKRVKRLGGKRQLTLWDLVTATIATHPEQATFETRRLRVIQDAGSQIGRVVEDETGSEVQVCTAFEPAAFEAMLWQVFDVTAEATKSTEPQKEYYASMENAE